MRLRKKAPYMGGKGDVIGWEGRPLTGGKFVLGSQVRKKTADREKKGFGSRAQVLT